jgi:hypothetical protein
MSYRKAASPSQFRKSKQYKLISKPSVMVARGKDGKWSMIPSKNPEHLEEDWQDQKKNWEEWNRRLKSP